MIGIRRVFSRGVLMAAWALSAVVAVPMAGAGLEETGRSAFRAWRSRSAFVMSQAGDELLFVENGPDGVCIKGARVSDGRVRILRRVDRSYYKIATIPGDRPRLFLSEEAIGSTAPTEAEILDLGTGKIETIGLGSRFGGDVVVSPTGRFVAVWVDYGCHNGDSNCFGETVAILSLDSGRREYGFKVPTVSDLGAEMDAAGQVRGTSERRIPLRVDVRWLDDVTVGFSVPAGKGTVETAVRRDQAGHWKVLEVVPPKVAMSSGDDHGRVVMGKEPVTVRRGSDRSQARVDPKTLFREPGGRVTVFEGEARVVVVRSAVGKDGFEAEEVVSLGWR